MLLAIDTSTRYAGVALAVDGQVVSSRNWFSRTNHTAELMPAIVATLQNQDILPKELSGIAVALGPGGFSALRVGVSTAKGLALANGKPILGLSTLELEAHPYIQSGTAVCSLLDVGRQEVAAARFGPDGVRLGDDFLGSLAELIPETRVPTIFCGEGLANWATLLREQLGEGAILAGWNPASRLFALADAGWKRLSAGERHDLNDLQPYYLRMPTIGGPKRRDRTPQASSRPGG